MSLTRIICEHCALVMVYCNCNRVYSARKVSELTGVPKTTVIKWVRSAKSDDGFKRSRYLPFGERRAKSAYLVAKDLEFFYDLGEILMLKRHFRKKWKDRILEK